ncbi:uncharacterized protein K460DRAFT_81536 [Cucurbitaria berberidis CBS 394.84]|uniref:C2H2-type domain-containing protein n=1 Tax=Cucurbitaria berberidis CBS 394.84 TaxID=1168544 RepID=A0A9P4LC61_9PLEO|nr:uncharacterized protein K460DRAFT_81536 [Cucurbitaria berberidis CBS 394.84]KAF1848839.1 hypothetical protein K460DRAFT_81536 [Cucurbitaria berberidis CBS 394.84]
MLYIEVNFCSLALFISLQLPPGSSAPADNNGRSSVAAMSGLTCYSSPLSFSPDPAFDSRNDWGFPTEPWPTSSATMSSESSITYLPAVFNNTSLGQPDPTTTPSPNVSLAQPVQEDSQSKHAQYWKSSYISLVCPKCPDKRYTGTWAHRNLNRHMESVHSPYMSPDGLRMFRCEAEGCNVSFRRADALLVHERRSHPELNRPPPRKKKRSCDP